MQGEMGGERYLWKDNVLEYCHHTPLFPSIQNHIDVCVYRAVTCSNKECEVVLPYNQLESHELTCSFRRVMCEHCDIEITIGQLEVRKRGVQLMGNGN